LIFFDDRVIDGHGPSLRGYDLQAYVTAGIRSDHETGEIEEAKEKINSGMMLMIREGTSAKNLQDLLPLLNDRNARRCCFVSDDIHPVDILEKGHLNHLIRKAVGLGLDPITAVQMVTLNPAEYFGLRKRGAVAPGYRADLVILENLENFVVSAVFKDGAQVVEQGILKNFPSKEVLSFKFKPLNLSPITPGSFRIDDENKKVRVIELVPGQIVTAARSQALRSHNGHLVSDTEADILKLAVLERHGATGRIGLGFVRGFGLKRGAMASSIAHDSHNVIAVGTNDRDLWGAVEELRTMGGGLAVTSDEKVLAKTPLGVAGLMSVEPIGTLIKQLKDVERAAMTLGCKIPQPFMSLSFLALPVIPELKLTDRGLVDVNQFKLVSLFVD
jgi:adenine deaminase